MLHKKIKSFTSDFLSYLEKQNKTFRLRPERCDEYNIGWLELTSNVSLRFLKSLEVKPSGGNPPYENYYYLTLFEGNKYLLQLFMCRILFNKDGNILWYLDTPSNPLNREVYEEFFNGFKEIPNDTVTQIKKQQEKIHRECQHQPFRKVNTGLLLANNLSQEETFAELAEMLFDICEKRDVPIDFSKVLLSENIYEGELQECTINRRKRSKEYIHLVKKRDNYTCQACGFTLEIGKKHILEVHHLMPLREITKINIDDLVCLCPTCHSIAHTAKKPLSVAEIKVIMKNYKKQA